jgi:putative salt-induced outer membrane protein
MKYSTSALFILTMAQPAQAALPDSAKAMVEAAIASGNEGEIDTIAKYVSQANPSDADQVTAMVAAHRASLEKAKQAKMENAGLFENWHGSGQLGGFMSSGNSDATGLTAGLGLTKEGVRWRHNFRAHADYQRSNGVTSRNQFLVALEPNYKFNDRLFAFGLAQFEKDKFAGFNSRYTLSGGLGYRVIKSENMTLDVKAGPAWRKTSLTGGGSESELNGLAALDYNWTITPALTFTENATAFIGSGNSVYTSLSALNVKLSSKLSAQAALQLRHETDPPLGFKNTDRLTRMSLVYGF